MICFTSSTRRLVPDMTSTFSSLILHTCSLLFCSLRKQPKFRDTTTSSPTKSVWNFCAHFLDLILRGKGQWWHHEMLTDFSGYKIGCAIYWCIMQPHTVVFLYFSFFFFLSANEGISSHECFKYP